MAEFDLTTETGMTGWRETLPEALRRDAAVVLVARAAARVLPLVWGKWPRANSDNWRNWQLFTCRATLASADFATASADRRR